MAILNSDTMIDLQSNCVTINPYSTGGVVHGARIVGAFISPVLIAIIGHIDAIIGPNTYGKKYLKLNMIGNPKITGSFISKIPAGSANFATSFCAEPFLRRISDKITKAKVPPLPPTNTNPDQTCSIATFDPPLTLSIHNRIEIGPKIPPSVLGP